VAPRLAATMQKRDRSPTPPKTDWSDVSTWYDGLVGDEGSEYQKAVVHPGVLRLLGDVKDRRILDVACGQGVLCRLLQQRGAHVTGIDAARPLIESARDRDGQRPPGAPPATFVCVEAQRLDEVKPLEGVTFDAATCVLAIQNIHPIGPVFQAVARKLKPGGSFVLAMMHPAFRGAKESHWEWTDDRSVQFRRVDRYLTPRKSPIVASPGKLKREGDTTYTWTFHKPIEAYVQAAVKAGLLIDALEEWASHKLSEPGAKHAAAENTARKEIPLFLALRCVKVERPTTRSEPSSTQTSSS
jgi:SAM-dependent methyltransferase